jgi:hypothetical protein
MVSDFKFQNCPLSMIKGKGQKNSKKGKIMPNTNQKESLYLLNRRQLLGLPFALSFAGAASAAAKIKIATVITAYHKISHADVIVGRLLEGYYISDEWRVPGVQVVSMYTDQVPDNDMSRDMAAKHDVKVYPTIRQALMMGTDDLAVEAVVLIGEHGKYPTNEKGQTLYPRHKLFKEIIEVFRETGKSVPVFSDKHLSYSWEKAKWMYDQSVELNFPLMAGSSLPVASRSPQVELDLESPVQKAVVSCYNGIEGYGFHGLESLQCMVERRMGGETGVKAVQCLRGSEVWRWTDENKWAERLLEECLSRCPESKPGSPRDNVKEPIVFILEYLSGLEAAVYLLNGQVSTFSFAADLKRKKEPVSFQFWFELEGTRAHFSGLVHHIEKMIITGIPSYPVERTLLTSGVLEALIDSNYQGGRRLETPHLHVSYQPKKGPFYNPGKVLNEMQKKR